MKKAVRINETLKKVDNEICVFLTDKETGAYLETLATSVSIFNGIVDLNDILYYGKDIFIMTVKEIRNVKGVKGFRVNGLHKDAEDCIKELKKIHNFIEEEEAKEIPGTYPTRQFRYI